eukprot:CAMPEP_0174949792 /NCGR_PEP_ID=MMETSP1355-20121228/92460_1 /TAXON_ID=464990 /ORGANISM="Hemiselmis tepida, Strain CCMP443" /LENGTH=34 /DNA_ID= /DNA_START= /DNA_END= /DNA_ORIENTATION=
MSSVAQSLLLASRGCTVASTKLLKSALKSAPGRG